MKSAHHLEDDFASEEFADPGTIAASSVSADFASDEPVGDRDLKPANVLLTPPSTALALVPALPAPLAPLAPELRPIHLRPDVTGSKGELAERCPAWMGDDVPWFAGDNSAALGGRVNHAVLASLIPGSAAFASPPPLPEDDASQAMIAEGRRWLEVRELFRRVGESKKEFAAILGLRAEVAFAIDLETGAGRELVDPPGWDTRWYADRVKRAAYEGPGGPLRVTELCLRVDLACQGIDAHGIFVRLWDYKFHFKPGWIDSRAQLEIASAAISAAWGIDRVQATGVHLWADREFGEEIVAPHDADGLLLCGPSGVPEFDRRSLDEVLAKARAWASRPANDREPVPGPHCTERYCPAIASCPVVTEEIVPQLLPPETLVRRPLGGALVDNDHAVWALTAAELLRSLAKELETKADAFADAHGGLVNPKLGLVYSGEPSTSESADLTKPGAIELLKSMGLDGAVKTVATWTDMKKGPGGAAKAKAAREALRKIDALAVTTGKRYDWRVPKAGGES